ncbi:MAG: hypothetical protein WBV90_06615 [Terrimicrobiaceae bacterium]
MLVQDTLTGAVHDVPANQLYEADYAESPEQMAEGQILYDGLGNPVGFSFLKKAFRKLAPFASKLAPFTSLLPIPGAGLISQAAQRVLPGVISKLGDGFYGEAVPVQPMPVQALQPPPPGWIPRPSPYLGRKGRRMYLRCVSWRGPKGLVPAVAAQAQPAPAVVAQPVPPGPVVMRPAVGRRFARRRRR